MLSHPNPLYFPKIKFTGDKDNPDRYEHQQYSLNWNTKENACYRNHIEWNVKHWPEQRVPHMPSLPQKLNIWVENLRFIITEPYRKEINRNARRCLEEWNVKRSFDTCVRENCLITAEAHALTAFYLLQDCAYDVENKTYYRKHNDDGILIKYALAYKFWAHQTGRGCIRQHARLDELERYANYDFHVANKDTRELGEVASSFLKAIDEHEKEWDKNSLKFQVETVEKIKQPLNK